MIAGLLKRCCNRPGDGGSDSTADYDRCAVVLDLRWLAQRPGDARDRFADLEPSKLDGAAPDFLEYDRDRSLIRVLLGYGARKALAVLAGPSACVGSFGSSRCAG